MEKARAMAREFAAKSPVVMKLARDSFMRANDFEYRRNIENVVETICNIIETDDAQEGIERLQREASAQLVERQSLPQLRDVSTARRVDAQTRFCHRQLYRRLACCPAGCCCAGANCPPVIVLTGNKPDRNEWEE